MAINGIDHVVIRVNDIEVAIKSYQNLGLELTKQLENDYVGKIAIFAMPNGTFIELVSPTDPNSDLAKALEKRGEGVHTVAFVVDELDPVVSTMKDGGATVIQTEDFADNAFVHPKSSHGVLLQMREIKP
jgi:methylmalonyl-CoA/ethylmalonyl-CoA epimerase